jgi:hypothetical protein
MSLLNSGLSLLTATGPDPGIDRLGHQEHKRGGCGTRAAREQRSALTARAMA